MSSLMDGEVEKEPSWKRFPGGGGGFKTSERPWSESSRELLGAQRRRRQHHCSSSALLLSNSVGVSGEAQIFITRKGRLWKLGGDARMGIMGSASVNFQVRSFCSYSFVPPHLDDSPFFSFFCWTFSRNLFSPLYLFSFPSQSFLILLLLQHFLSYSTLRIIMDEQKLRPPPAPFLAAPSHNLFCRCPASALTVAPSVPHLPT